MDQNQALGADGVGETVVIDGTTLTFMPVDQGMQVDFTAWLKARLKAEGLDTASVMRRRARKLWREAKAAMDQMMDAKSDQERADLSAKIGESEDEAGALELEAREHVQRTDERMAAGACGYGNKLANEALAAAEGSIKLYHLMLAPKQPRLSLDAVARLYYGSTTIEEPAEAPAPGVDPPAPKAPKRIANAILMRDAALACEGAPPKKP